jgi:hypothetical protein
MWRCSTATARGWTAGRTAFPIRFFSASYGRNPANPSQLGFLTTATPGTNNTGPFFAGRVEAPFFKGADGTNDLPGGLYPGAASLTLVLTTPRPAARFVTRSMAPSRPGLTG